MAGLFCTGQPRQIICRPLIGTAAKDQTVRRGKQGNLIINSTSSNGSYFYDDFFWFSRAGGWDLSDLKKAIHTIVEGVVDNQMGWV